MTWGVQNTEAEGHEQMAYALERGVTFWDTAEIYPVPPKKEVAGDTERIMGTFFKGNLGARDKVVLATKVKRGGERTALRARAAARPHPHPPPLPQVAGYGIDYLRPDLGPARVTKEHVVRAVDGSLARMGVDAVDLLQVHWPDRYVPLFGSGAFDQGSMRETVPFEEQLEALRTVVDAGKVGEGGRGRGVARAPARRLQPCPSSLSPRSATWACPTRRVTASPSLSPPRARASARASCPPKTPTRSSCARRTRPTSRRRAARRI